MAQNFPTGFAYDVFLSFRGKDTRYAFTGNLNAAFLGRGIKTFFDDQKLRVGDELSDAFLTAIEKSRMFVIVLSENYASSTWCLNELVKILQYAEPNRRRIWPIFYKVDPSVIRYQKDSYDKAMIKHEQRFGKDSEKVRNWRSALAKVADLKGYHLTRKEYEYQFFENIAKEISGLLPKYFYVEEQVVGLGPRKKEVESLLDISSCDMVCMLGIHGIGGIGKTTLAKALYRSIADEFDHVKFLYDVRETSNRPEGLLGLQKKLLSNMSEEENINSIDEGANQIRNTLYDKRVLLVLDDVNCINQLKMLAGKSNWFGSGSRIIVTTRDRNLLHVHEFENTKSYEMTGLNSHEALELFCLKAFKRSQPPKEFEDLSNDIINYAGGLPLALKVIGSNLYGNDLQTCVSALDQYKRMLHKEIQNILRVSYDSLNVYQKDIFLDIACFFRGHSLEEFENIMDACYPGSAYSIKVIINKSLITVESGCIQMHDLIQDMGKEIVMEGAPDDPERRSRLWLDEEIVRILEGNSGTSKIKGIMLKGLQQKIEWEGTAFQKMQNLRILIIKDIDFSVGPQYLPNNLRILEWNQYPLTLLPPKFDPKNLVVLQMPNSSLKLEKSFKNLAHLTIMNFSCCHSIIEVPDMSGCSAIRSLNFSQCKNLVKVHNSIGFLTELTDLNLASCKSLASLPSTMQMGSLEIFNIDDCTSLEYFPVNLGSMDRLSIICASNTAIKELPNSIGNLMSLNQLKVSWSANLVSIPESIRKLSNLKKLDIEECRNLQEICEIPPNLRSINAGNCTSLTPHSCSVLSSQAIKETCDLTIDMPGAQIPSWFDYCCKGRLLSFWTRQKLPNIAFAFIYRCEYAEHEVKLRLFINGKEVKSIQWGYFCGYKPSHMYLKDLNQLWGGNRIKGLETYLVQEWNYIDIEVLEHHDFFVDECGIYVYNQGTRMEDILRFDFPYQSPFADLVLRNALKRRADLVLRNALKRNALKRRARRADLVLRNALKRNALKRRADLVLRNALKKEGSISSGK